MSLFQSLAFLQLLRIEKPLLQILIWIRTLGTMASIGLIVYYFGFPLTVEGQFKIIEWQNSLLGVFALSFVIRWLFARFQRSFLQVSSLETLLLGLWCAEGLWAVMGRPWFAQFTQNYADLLPYAWFVHTLAIGLAGLELIRLSNSVVTVRLKPAATLMVSFMVLIGIGT
nr:hypothetical protein [Sphingomonadales bacterium]